MNRSIIIYVDNPTDRVVAIYRDQSIKLNDDDLDGARLFKKYHGDEGVWRYLKKRIIEKYVRIEDYIN